MPDMEPWTRQLLSVIVSQICKTMGWHSISTTCLQILVDVLDRYLKQLGTNIHGYTNHFNHTFPSLEEVQLAFVEMGINVEDLKEYVDYVTPLPIKIKVPKYPLEKKSNLNFLKPGSREVVTRPVHIHEHLPAMHPELSEEYNNQELIFKEDPLPNLSNVSTPVAYKNPDNEPVNKKLMNLISEEIGRPLRELTSVMMTTSGFLSPAREGKVPEARLPKISTQTSVPNQPSLYPNVPPEVKGEHKKSGHSSKSNSAKAERKIKEEHQIKDEHDDSKVQKLVSMKELSKLKAFKPVSVKTTDTIDSAKITKQEKLKLTSPSSPKEPKLKPVKVEKIEKYEPEIVEEKLTTEPNKQKLNIFKRISKVKEERPESPVPKTSVAEKNAQINECIEAVIKRSREIKEEPITRDECRVGKSAPFEEPTLFAPEPVVKVKRKKKQKHDSPNKRIKTELAPDAEKLKQPKFETEMEPPPYAFFTQLQTTPGLISPALSQNLLIPTRFTNPFLNLARLDPNSPHPEMPNLPLPPVTMHAHIEHPKPFIKDEIEKKPADSPNVSDKKLKKKMKKDKREREKKKRDKKEKLKNKEKLNKKKDKILKKIKLKNKEKLKIKKERKLNSQKKEEPSEDSSVPKLKLKIGGSNSPQLSPSGIPSPKIVIKPIVKHDDVANVGNHFVKKEDREQSPELAKISALTGKPVKIKSKFASETVTINISKPVVEPTTITILKSKKLITCAEIKPKNKDKQARNKKVEESKPRPPAYYYDADGNQVWICPACGAQDDGSPMIGCDGCDAWYHWVCVGIKSAPDSAKWFCGTCAAA